MSYKFKKKIFSFLDLIRFTKIVPHRERMLEEGSSEPLKATDDVFETMKLLHPGLLHGKLIEKKEVAPSFVALTFEIDKPFYFKAGQYLSLSADVDGGHPSRPYAIVSSPLAALRDKKVEIAVKEKKGGILSTYLVEKIKLGDCVELRAPLGDFYHEPLRDHEDVVAIAGGSGIAPFVSMARSIAEGSDDFRLHVYYGAKTEKDLAFKDELDQLAKNPKIDVTYVLETKTDGYPTGYVTAELIKKAGLPRFSAFLSGPNPMIAFANKELSALGLVEKDIRAEANPIGNRESQGKTYKLTVHIQDKVYEIPARDDETLLVAMERAAIRVPSSCRAGGCGVCHAKLLSGKFTIAGADKRREADRKFGYVHACASYPDSDIELDIPKAM